jgi:hypothetical protein
MGVTLVSGLECLHRLEDNKLSHELVSKWQNTGVGV